MLRTYLTITIFKNIPKISVSHPQAGYSVIPQRVQNARKNALHFDENQKTT